MPEPFPLPGSAEARALGCTCWAATPGMGVHRPRIGRYRVRDGHVYTYGCPLHWPEGEREPRKENGTLGIDNLNEIRAILSNVALEGNERAAKLLEYINAGQTVEERMRRAFEVWGAKGWDKPCGGDG